MSVKSHVYQTIAELNAGLEKAIHNLQLLQGNQLFGASGLTAMNHLLREIRSRANHQLMMASTHANLPTPAISNRFTTDRSIPRCPGFCARA
jgi:hypothetical protein